MPLRPDAPLHVAPHARLLIYGLDVAPNLARRGLEGTMGWNGQYDEEQRVAAALGYMAHVVSKAVHVAIGIPQCKSLKFLLCGSMH